MSKKRTHRLKLTHSLAVAAVILLVGTVSGCTSTGSSTTASPSTQSATVAPAGDTTAMCAEFTKIAAGAGSASNSADPTTKEGWDLKVAATTLFVDAAPAEWQVVAQTYLGIVEDREALLAGYGYPLITDLPADVRSAFIADHTAAQGEANTFIAYAKDACGVG